MIKQDGKSATENLLDDISDFYKIGLKLYEQQKYAEAEKKLADILKFTFNAGLITKLYFTRESEIIIDTIYHLGSIYEKRSDIDCNYSKAAAIFQYGYMLTCKNFNSMYQVNYISELTTDKLYNYRNKFLDKVKNIEQIFLHEAKSQLSISNNHAPTIFPIGIERSFFNLAKEKLINLRVETKHKIENIDKDNIAIEERSKKIQEIYSNINKFFANDQESGLIQQLFQDCELQLGKPPCKYAVITLGSLSVGMMTPWSDFEFAILIENNANKKYFRLLTELMHIKIINFGETILRSVGIESLNNFKTGKKEDDWFWDQLIESGLSFDGPQWYACKTPIGRKGYKKISDVKNDSEQEGIQLINIPDYELILTPAEMYQLSLRNNRDAAFDSDKYFLQSLRSAGLLYGDQDLLTEYRNLFRCQEKSFFREQEIQILKEDLSKYDLELHKNKDGNLINVKAIYRLPERIIVSLANYNFIILEDDNKYINCWEMLGKMLEEKLISSSLGLALQKALTITAEFRLKSYCYNGAQIEKIAICDPAIVTHFDDDQKLALKNKTLIVEDTDLLSDFYCTISLIKNSIDKLLCTESDGINGIDSINIDSLSENINLRHQVHRRFLEYDKAIGHDEEKKDSNEESSLETFHNWLNALKVYVAKCDTDKAQNIADQLLAFIKEAKYLSDSHYDIYAAETYRQVGIMYFNNESYEEAIKSHKKEYEIYLKTNAPIENIRIFTCCMHIANLYFKLEQYDQAIYYFCRVQNISQDIIKSSPNCMLQFFTVSGYLHKIYGGAEEARNYFSKALSALQQIEQDNPSHPTVFTIYEHIGDLLYSNNKHFKSAVYFRDALDLLAQFNNKQDFCNEHIARILVKLGDIDQDLQFGERACEYYFAAINYMKNNDQLLSNQTLASAYYKFAFSAYYVGQIYVAVEYYERAINILIEGSDYCDPNVIHKHNELKSNCYSIDQDMIDIYSDLVATHLNLVLTNDATEDVFEENVKAVIDYSRRLLSLLQMQSPKNPKKIKDTENIIYELAEATSYGTCNTVENLLVERDVLGLDQLIGQCETPFVSINAEQF